MVTSSQEEQHQVELTVMWLHPVSFWTGVLQPKAELTEEKREGINRTYQDNTSILFSA